MRRLWLVGIKRGNAGLCEPCRRGDHENCEPVPVAVDQMGIGIDSIGYVECRCLCMPEWMREALDNGHVPAQRDGDGNHRFTVFELAAPSRPAVKSTTADQFLAATDRGPFGEDT